MDRKGWVKSKVEGYALAKKAHHLPAIPLSAVIGLRVTAPRKFRSTRKVEYIAHFPVITVLKAVGLILYGILSSSNGQLYNVMIYFPNRKLISLHHQQSSNDDSDGSCGQTRRKWSVRKTTLALKYSKLQIRETEVMDVPKLTSNLLR